MHNVIGTLKLLFDSENSIIPAGNDNCLVFSHFFLGYYHLWAVKSNKNFHFLPSIKITVAGLKIMEFRWFIDRFKRNVHLRFADSINATTKYCFKSKLSDNNFEDQFHHQSENKSMNVLVWKNCHIL